MPVFVCSTFQKSGVYFTSVSHFWLGMVPKEVQSRGELFAGGIMRRKEKATQSYRKGYFIVSCYILCSDRDWYMCTVLCCVIFKYYDRNSIFSVRSVVLVSNVDIRQQMYHPRT